ncbi:MAG: 30S ribosomal protein S12 methylthiotransferase RimO [Candidatus Kapaibacteriota bacterium]|jgi:ribosomal protein S12 methylthiotransferase
MRLLNKEKLTKIDSVAVITMGCAKNLVDSERFSGLLQANGFNMIDNPANADALIINTCGFIKAAKEENIQVIMEAADLRRRRKYKKLIVTGCLAERYNTELRQQIKNVDYFLGVNSDETILKILKNDEKYELIGDRMMFTPKHYAYLKISEGCNQKCTFCAIPLMRGKHLSEPIEKLIKEAERLAENGTKELVLIAQDSTYYGKDLYGKRILQDLMERLSEIKGIEWIRIMYAYPRSFPFEVLETMASKSNICNYIDIPLQHASDKVLKSMRRGVTRVDIEEIVTKIRAAVPDVAIRSTFIVGYPNETEADVDELCDFLEKNQLDRVGVFTYSHEEGTGAYPLGDPIPQSIKDARRERVMLTQQKISLAKNQAKIGKTFRVLIEERQDNKYIGRTEYDAPDVDNTVTFETSESFKIGDFATVKITSAEEYEIFGELA